MLVLTGSLLISLVVSSGSVSLSPRDSSLYRGYKLYRAEVFPAQLPIVDSLDSTNGVEIWNCMYKPTNDSYQMDVLTSPEKNGEVKNVLDEVHLRYETVIDDLQAVIEKENSKGEQPQLLLENRYGHPMTWTSYHSSDDIVEYMKYLETTFPHIVSVLKIGESVERRPLYVAKVSHKSTSSRQPGSRTKKAIWIDGGIHAREWISPAVVSYFLHRLVEVPAADRKLVESFDWYIMPLANPDGYEYSRQHDRLWRKNRAGNSKMPCKGVDLNRNFDFKWDSRGSSMFPCAGTYRGPAPNSEPETKAISNFVSGHKNELSAFVSIHSYKQLWMYPWAYSKQPLDSPANEKAAVKATEAINNFKGSKQYKHGRIADLLYRAAGSSIDFAYGKLKIPYVFALELRDRGEFGFLLPKEQIIPTAKETTVGLMAMAKEILANI